MSKRTNQPNQRDADAERIKDIATAYVSGWERGRAWAKREHPCCRHCVTEPGEDHPLPHRAPCDLCAPTTETATNAEQGA